MSSTRNPSSRMFPELERFSTPQDGRKALSLATRRQLRKWKFWGYLVAYYAVVGLALVAMVRTLGEYVRIPYSVRGGLVGGVLGGMSFGAMRWFWRNPIRRHLRRQLQEQRTPICLNCGYDLRGQLTPRCPECGSNFDKTLIARMETEG